MKLGVNMRFWGILCFVIGLLWSSVSTANVVITGTRVVYPAQNKEIGIELTNTTDTPALLQAWISQADSDNHTPTPFVITPPVFRMDGNKRQTLRVIHTHEPLATDRETLFYFNLLDIPPVPKVDDNTPQNYLQFSLLSKLKFFYRPKNLKPSIDKAYEQLTATYDSQGVVITNPTPYYMTVSGVALLAHPEDKDPIAQTALTPMIEPFGQAHVELDTSHASRARIAKLTLINDYGGHISMPLPLTSSNMSK